MFFLYLILCLLILQSGLRLSLVAAALPLALDAPGSAFDAEAGTGVHTFVAQLALVGLDGEEVAGGAEVALAAAEPLWSSTLRHRHQCTFVTVVRVALGKVKRVWVLTGARSEMCM